MILKSKFRCALGIILFALCSGCGVYSFRNTSIPPNVKTAKVGYFNNRARYISPQLAPKLTDAFQQMVSNQTKLKRTDDDNADYVINATITNYDVSTSGISAQQASLNRLTVGVHVVFVDNTKAGKVTEYDVSRPFDFPAGQSLQQAEGNLMSDIVKNVSEEIFNHIFANW
ncbi:MAG: LPS assembly lipoprotein LptE [Chitinophagaceae bacterium]|nr:LPS assembly lipoprotein LptE [Chitinophagaceae bacterium]